MPFMIYTEKEGVLQVYEARAILDASGTWEIQIRQILMVSG